MSADLGYINARVRGLKSRLLGPEFYAQALGDSDFRAFLATLAQTPYMRDLEEAQAQSSGLTAVDVALSRNFFRTARSILGFSDGRPHDLIALLLLRYDLMNLKAIARAKHAGRGREETLEALLAAGQLKPAVLEALVAAPDLPAAAQALAVTDHPLAEAFTKAVRAYVEESDLFDLELSLDRAYYAAVHDGLERLGAPREIRSFFAREVDATNLRTALKLRGRGPATADLFIPGGREIDRATFDALLLDAGPEALGVLAGTAFADVAATTDLSAAEAAIRRVLDRSAHRLARDPLGPGVVLDFLRRKETEAARLRLLARGKFYSVPRAQLERELDSVVA